MTKKGPLGKAEEFYIKHNFQSVDVDTLCKDLDRAKSLVERYIEKCKKEVVESEPFNAQNQFIHKRGATMMTPEAAVLADAIKKTGSKTRPECVTKIK